MSVESPVPDSEPLACCRLAYDMISVLSGLMSRKKLGFTNLVARDCTTRGCIRAWDVTRRLLLQHSESLLLTRHEVYRIQNPKLCQPLLARHAPDGGASSSRHVCRGSVERPCHPPGCTKCAQCQAVHARLQGEKDSKGPFCQGSLSHNQTAPARCSLYQGTSRLAAA